MSLYLLREFSLVGRPLWPPDHQKEDFPKTGLSLDGREFLETGTPGPLEAEEVPTWLARLAVMWLGGLGAGLGGLWPVRVLGNLVGDRKQCISGPENLLQCEAGPWWSYQS